MNQASDQTTNNLEVRPLENIIRRASNKDNKDQLIVDDVLPDIKFSDKKKINIHDIEGFFEEVSTTPTHTPKNFWDSFKIYNDELYVFSPKTHTWNAPTTTVNAHHASGVGTIVATGTFSVTGLSFQPQYIRITAQAETGYGSSIGATDGTNISLLLRTWDGSTLNSSVSGVGTHLIDVWDDANTDNTTATFSSMNIDGFTINVDNYYSEIDILWEAYR